MQSFDRAVGCATLSIIFDNLGTYRQSLPKKYFYKQAIFVGLYALTQQLYSKNIKETRYENTRLRFSMRGQ